jgi:quinol monooxygenase YgiN
MTVISLLDFTVKAEELDAAPSLITETLKATRAFDGSLGVDVSIDVNDPAHVVLVERWESIEHDDAYRAFRATPDGASKLGTIVAGPPTLTRFTVADGV